MKQMITNLHPLWWLIDYDSRKALIQYQREAYDTEVQIPALPVSEIPVDYDKFVKQTRRHFK